MDRYREQLNKPVVIAVLGGIVGLILGLVIGWAIWPVQWYDAAPVHMRQDVQADYLRMTIDSYARNGDEALALRRWRELGEKAPDLLTGLQLDPGSLSPGDLATFSTLVGSIPAAPAVTTAPGQPTAAAVSPLVTPEPEASGGSPLITVLIILLLLTLVIGGILAYMFLFRGRATPLTFFNRPRAAKTALPDASLATDYTTQGQETPVAQFMTTYAGGDDQYDDSFSIDAPSGEFLGECGVGISDTIGVGDPKKVTAFEVWLFDKNDIQTVTRVLMSEHAFNDQAIRQRLSSKGEHVMIEPGERVLLETATLVLEARVVDLSYGTGALPPNSFFDRLTLELAIWPKVMA